MAFSRSSAAEVDVLVVGAGITGVYQLYRAREAGFSVALLEAGDSSTQDSESDVDETCADTFEDHSLYRGAFALTIWIDQLFDQNPSLQNEPAAVKLATHAALASAKLAAALSDDDVDEIGMTIAYLKRALKAITTAMDRDTNVPQAARNSAASERA